MRYEFQQKGKMHIFKRFSTKKIKAFFKNDESRGVFSFLINPQLTRQPSYNFPVKVNSSSSVFIMKKIHGNPVSGRD